MEGTFESGVVDALGLYLRGLITSNEAIMKMIRAAREFEILIDESEIENRLVPKRKR